MANFQVRTVSFRECRSLTCRNTGLELPSWIAFAHRTRSSLAPFGVWPFFFLGGAGAWLQLSPVRYQCIPIVGIGILKGNVGLSYEHCKKVGLKPNHYILLTLNLQSLKLASVGRRSSFRFEHPCRSTKTLTQRKTCPTPKIHGAKHLLYIYTIATPRNTCIEVKLRSHHVPRLFLRKGNTKVMKLITCFRKSYWTYLGSCRDC